MVTAATKACRLCDVMPTAVSPRAIRIEDAISTRRGPKRSVSAPTTGDISPLTMAIGATTAATAVRSQPVSSTIGRMKTLKP